MSKELEYSPHLYYAKIKDSSKYKYQHEGFFPVKQHKDIDKSGIWIGNNNLYPETEIQLFEFQSKQGFFQFANLDKNVKSLHYTMSDLKIMGLDKPVLEDTKWRNDC
jgi:hypothetical protein